MGFEVIEANLKMDTLSRGCFNIGIYLAQLSVIDCMNLKFMLERSQFKIISLMHLSTGPNTLYLCVLHHDAEPLGIPECSMKTLTYM